MEPFDVPPALDALLDTYPSAKVLLRSIKEGDRNTRYAVARLWLSEGIPWYFRNQPGLYEVVRRYIAKRIGINAKEITLIGSGRTGYSMGRGSEFGRKFDERSDLDFSAISETLFERLKASFIRWSEDYVSDKAHPRNAFERAFWNDNIESVPKGLEKGFIDPRKIPTWKRYPESQDVAQALWEAHVKLTATPNTPAIRDISIRVYNNWDSFIDQRVVNLENVAEI